MPDEKRNYGINHELNLWLRDITYAAQDDGKPIAGSMRAVCAVCKKRDLNKDNGGVYFMYDTCQDCYDAGFFDSDGKLNTDLYF